MNTPLRREKILQEAASLGLLDAEEALTAAFLDLDLVAQNVAALMRAFPSHVPTLHAFAAKASATIGANGDVCFTVLREQQTMAELLAASGSELDAAGRLPWNELKSSAKLRSIMRS